MNNFLMQFELLLSDFVIIKLQCKLHNFKV